MNADERKAYLTQVEAMRRQATAPVFQRSGSVGAGKDTFLSVKGAERVSHLRELIAQGVNPYTKDQMEKDGGTSSPVVQPRERIDADDPRSFAYTERQAQIVKLAEKWAKGVRGECVGRKVVRPDTDDDLSDIEMPDYTEHKPGILYCSWCDREVSAFEATYGRTPTVVRTIEEVRKTSEDPDEYVTDVKHRAQSRKKIACPDHALILSQTCKIIFPDFD